MPGAVIGTSMNLGFPGSYARNAECLIDAILVKSDDTTGPSFGDPVELRPDSTAGQVSKAGASTVMTLGVDHSFMGFAVREVKSFETFIGTGAAPGAAPTLASYSPGTVADVIVRGNVMVQSTDPQAAGFKRGGKVYLRITANVSYPNSPVGGIEPAADGGNTIELTNCKFATGIVDANGVVEVSILSRNNP